MEGQYPLNFSQRGFSREGNVRVPSREKQITTPEVRKKLPSKTTLSVSGQNFFSQSQVLESQSSTDDLMLSSLNIAVDETAFVTTTKVDLLQLQEEINKMDIDGKIRNTNPSNILKKNHTYAMAKFLQKHSNQNVKLWIDKRLNHASTFDTTDLLKFMGVTSESEGLRKLFKMLGIFDLMLIKLTEYQTVTFLKYDQIFESLRKQLGGQPPVKTASMDAGLAISRFQVDMANLERLFELFGFVGKLSQQQNKSTPLVNTSQVKVDNQASALKGVTSVDELYSRLKGGEDLGLDEELIDGLLRLVEKSFEAKTKEGSMEKRIKLLEKELSEKNSKLTTMVEFSAASDRSSDNSRELQERIDQLQKEAESVRKEMEVKFAKDLRARESELKEKVRKLEYEAEVKDGEIQKLKDEVESLRNAAPQQTESKGNDNPFNADYYIKMIKQIEDNFGKKIRDLENDNHSKNQDIVDLKSRLEAAELKKEDYMSRMILAERQVEAEAKRASKDDGSYEAALREQFSDMKEGFEQKIQKLNSEIQQIKKEKSLELLEIKKELTREKEGRELLLRKLQIYTKT